MKGDWHPDTVARPTFISIQLASHGAVQHVGISYDLLSPSGAVLAQRAFTWDVPHVHRVDLERVMGALVNEAIADEGLAGVEYMKPPAV